MQSALPFRTGGPLHTHVRSGSLYDQQSCHRTMRESEECEGHATVQFNVIIAKQPVAYVVDHYPSRFKSVVSEWEGEAALLQPASTLLTDHVFGPQLA